MNENSSTPVSKTPDWAKSLGKSLFDLEVKIGTIKTIKADAKYHSVIAEAELAALSEQNKTKKLATLADDWTPELLFEKLVLGLRKEGFSAEQIAEIVNQMVPTGCNLPYCNAEEVDDVIGLDDLA